MAMFGRRRADDEFERGEPGVTRMSDSRISFLCPADKHLLADLLPDGTLRIWDRRCKRLYTFEIAGSLQAAEKERVG